MKESIPICDKQQYSLAELSDIMHVLLTDADDAYFEVEDLHIPREKVFQIVRAVLRHISETCPGEFELISCSPTNYQLIYRENQKSHHSIDKEDNIAKEEKDLSNRPYRPHHHNAAVTALRLEDMTGKLPGYAKYEPYATLVADMKAKIKYKSKVREKT